VEKAKKAIEMTDNSSLSLEKIKLKANTNPTTGTLISEARSALLKNVVMMMIVMKDTLFGNSLQVSSWVASASPSLSKAGSSERRSRLQSPELLVRMAQLSKWDKSQMSVSTTSTLSSQLSTNNNSHQ